VSTVPTTRLGGHLWRLLPRIYRQHDNGHLALYLDAFGEVLDRIRATLEQRLRDTSPTTCQPWLLPYFAELLDVRLVSPEVDGQREEVANAVAWRQRKGTAPCVEEIAERVGVFEVEVHEGWRRVATTARIGMPLLPVQALGETAEPDLGNPLEATKHPGLPVATVDFRVSSRARQVDHPTPVSRRTTFAGERVTWQQANVHGAPCFPDSFEDVSRRTVDLRTPRGRAGRYHPRNLLLYVPPPLGFFSPGQRTLDWADRLVPPEGETPVTAGPGGAELPDGTQLTVTVHRTSLFEELDEVIEHPQGGRERRRSFRTLGTDIPAFRGAIHFDEEPAGGERWEYVFQRLALLETLTVEYARVRLEQVAATEVIVLHVPDVETPVLRATDCLLGFTRTAMGLTELEYCTVLTGTLAEALHASDCILLGFMRADLDETSGPPRAACVRYSCVPLFAAITDFTAFGDWSVYTPTLVTEPPVFYGSTFGTPGCGVLHQEALERICFGAEDGGEMGAYHHRRYCLREHAVLSKLEEFVPVATRPVVLRDERLMHAPPVRGSVP